MASMVDQLPNPQSQQSTSTQDTLREFAGKSLILVTGKGGVGKTAVSKALYQALSPLCISPRSALRVGSDSGDFENPEAAFKEYIEGKIRVPFVSKILTQNKLVTGLIKAAPGVPELLILGKIWNLSQKNHCTIVDMPSTGHGLAMFHSVENFNTLFGAGPLKKDTEAMLATLSDPKQTAFIIVTLAEESPLKETEELCSHLERMFPENTPHIWINRMMGSPDLLSEIIKDPSLTPNGDINDRDSFDSPFAESTSQFISRKKQTEAAHIRQHFQNTHHLGGNTQANRKVLGLPWVKDPANLFVELSKFLTERSTHTSYDKTTSH